MKNLNIIIGIIFIVLIILFKIYENKIIADMINGFINLACIQFSYHISEIILKNNKKYFWLVFRKYLYFLLIFIWVLLMVFQIINFMNGLLYTKYLSYLSSLLWLPYLITSNIHKFKRIN